MLVSSIVSKVSGGCDWVVILPRLWQWCRQGSQFWSFAVALAIFLVPLHLSFAFCYCHDWFLLHAETPPLLRWHFLQLVCPAVLVDFWHHFWVSPWCVISVLCSLWMCWPSSTVPRPHRSWSPAGVAMVLDLVFHPKCHFNGWCRKCQVSGWCQCMHFADDGSVVAHSKQWNKQSRHFNNFQHAGEFYLIQFQSSFKFRCNFNCHQVELSYMIHAAPIKRFQLPIAIWMPPPPSVALSLVEEEWQPLFRELPRIFVSTCNYSPSCQVLFWELLILFPFVSGRLSRWLVSIVDLEPRPFDVLYTRWIRLTRGSWIDFWMMWAKVLWLAKETSESGFRQIVQLAGKIT